MQDKELAKLEKQLATYQRDLDLVEDALKRPYDVFISYSRDDYRKIYEKGGKMLEEVFPRDQNPILQITEKLTLGGLNFWYDREGLSTDFIRYSAEKIDNCKLMIFVSSYNSNYHSKWTSDEISYAKERKIPIIVFMIDAEKLNKQFRLALSSLNRIENYPSDPTQSLGELLACVRETLSQLKKDKKNLQQRIKSVKEEMEVINQAMQIEQERVSLRADYDKAIVDVTTMEASANSKRMEVISNYQKSTTNILDSTDCCCQIENETNCITYEAKCNYISDRGNVPSMKDGAVGGAIVGGLFSAVYGCISNLFKERFCDSDYTVFASLFSSTEVKRKSHLLVQIFMHLLEETEKVKTLAQESDKYAERRDYIPLQCRLKKGDKVDVHLNIYGETLLISEMKSVIWQRKFTKCSFDYFVPKDIDVDELSCMAMLSVNGVPIGEMRFITRIVDEPRQLNPEIISHKYNKVFISYAHQDEAQVKSFHEGLNVAGIEHFFDRKYLKAGDVFPQVIQDYINSADLFVLYWSENAAESEYVRKERIQALKRAFPQVKPEQQAKLRIYPMCIEPRADLPADMKDYYHFGVL